MADWGNCLEKVGEQDIVTLRCIPFLFQNLIEAALGFSGVVALFFIIFAGYKFIRASDPKQAEDAKKTLTYAIIGLVLILLSFAFINIISFVTGVECINAFGFTNCQ